MWICLRSKAAAALTLTFDKLRAGATACERRFYGSFGSGQDARRFARLRKNSPVNHVGDCNRPGQAIFTVNPDLIPARSMGLTICSPQVGKRSWHVLRRLRFFRCFLDLRRLDRRRVSASRRRMSRRRGSVPAPAIPLRPECIGRLPSAGTGEVSDLGLETCSRDGNCRFAEFDVFFCIGQIVQRGFRAERHWPLSPIT